MILDTCFLIDFMNGEKNTNEKLQELSKEEVFLITSLSVFEIYTGLARCEKYEHEKKKALDLLDGQLVIPLDEKAAEIAGKIDGELFKNGEKIEIIDSMISGICLLRKEKLLTKNIKHFSKIKDLKIESY